MELVINYLLLFIGFSFTFFLPGFLVIETFFKNLAKIQKIPLYFFLSVLVSTYLVYFVSHILGYSRASVIFSFLLFIPWIIWVIKRTGSLKSYLPERKHYPAVFLSLFIFAFFLIALYPAIFTKHKGYINMSASNWQDTPMHLGIIESISQGNFPPQAPYYSGVPLNYYYFADFHSAILATLGGTFFPRILVYDNPFFVFIFSLSLYALAYYVTRRRLAALFATFLGVFFGNLMFIRFFQDISKFSFGHKLLPAVRDLLANQSYAMEFMGLFQVAPMVDNFLQNRPMMVGLPGVVLVSLLVYSGLKIKDNKRMLLAGFIAGMLAKFQLLAYGVCFLVFLLGFLIFFDRKNYKQHFKIGISFALPFFLFLPLLLSISVNQRSLISLIRENSSFLGTWDGSKTSFWHLKFILANLGFPFVISLLALLAFIIKRRLPGKNYLFLFPWAALLFAIPYTVKFTIFPWDMFKFFNFMLIPTSIITGEVLSKLLRFKVIGVITIAAVFLVSSSGSFLTLANSYLDKRFAYSLDDYQAGIWIRSNTAPRSVFIGLPTVHSPTTQIGGRLRVLSYINWPYSHGFNRGEDNVFARLSDIESIFENPGDEARVLRLMRKYKAEYIYYGREEKAKYPEAGDTFSGIEFLDKVYDITSVTIYGIRGDFKANII